MSKVSTTFTKKEIVADSGCYSNYCSLFEDDGIEKIVAYYNSDKLLKIIEQAKTNMPELSGTIDISNIVHVHYFDADNEGVTPQFHQAPVVSLFFGAYCEGMVSIESTSRFDVSDNHEVSFFLETEE